MDYLSIIKQPIQKDLDDFIALFQSALSHDDGMLGSALGHIRQRGGKRMRPILMLLMARNFGDISKPTYYSYIDALKKLFVIEDISGWNPKIKSKASMRSGIVFYEMFVPFCKTVLGQYIMM